jgi:O-antigen ligase
MMPSRVRNAIIIAFICHGLFVLTGRYRLSYDAFTHMLFADHYASSWFSLWETRWYTGFPVVSYPPLAHQLIAFFVPLLGFEKAYALILWLVTTFYPLGIYVFCRIFTSKTAASYAALASAILLPIYVTAHIFGQLPFLFSTLLALCSAVSLNRYLREGGLHNFVLTVSLYTTTMALHHATLLVQPFLVFAVVWHHIVHAPHAIRWPQFALRFTLSSFSSVLFGILVIWPFWQWGTNQTMQTPIDHLSRHNFFGDPLALSIFFFPMYGPLVFFIPCLFRKWPLRFLGLLISFFLLFLLGLGGTTSLPRFFFGNSWEWLTYDRFAFWASLTLLPLLSILFIEFKRKFRRPSTWMPTTIRRGFIQALIFSLFVTTALGAWFTPYFFPVQPDPINMQPIVDFLRTNNRSQYRYLTFGFGDQFAYLNLLTRATTIDGSYHTARTLPELRKSGIGQIDTAYWALKGIAAIEPILKNSGEYGVRWGFVNPNTMNAVRVRWGTVHRNPFVPALEKTGWVYFKTLPNDIQVWENPQAIIPEKSPNPKANPFTTFSWGVFPILSLVTTMSFGWVRIYPATAERVIKHVYSIAIALLPISLCLWFYKAIVEFPYHRVYFTYTDVLFFFSDALILLAVMLWFAVKVAHLSNDRVQASLRFPLSPVPHSSAGQFILHPSSFTLPLLLIIVFASCSVFWSRDWRISLYVSLHFWLIFLLILSLRDWHQAWKFAAIGFCVALGIEIFTSFIGFATQSTGFLKSLPMEWPGTLDSSIRGASVVQLSNGTRFLRAYGTLPHPNLLGGVVLVSLLGTSSLLLTGNKARYPILILHSLGIILLVITFSRSAWLGFLAGLGILIMKSRYFDRKRLFLFLATIALTVILTLYPLRELVWTRVSNAPVATEQLAIFGREWLNQQALDMFRDHPFTGVGIGSFIMELASYAVEGVIIEPAHNIFLLTMSELGILGLLLVLILFILIGVSIFKARTPNAILASVAVIGLGVISLFDHYLWTLAPGRVLLALTLGLWLAQVNHDA